jgi:hypothetical protein
MKSLFLAINKSCKNKKDLTVNETKKSPDSSVVIIKCIGNIRLQFIFKKSTRNNFQSVSYRSTSPK